MIDRREEAEFTSAWDTFRTRFNTIVPCPECEVTEYKGKVEREEFKLVGGIYEPFGKWIDCDNCAGLGEIEGDYD